ncbi:hypothetical protein [Nonomuraea pusilla]|uniref:Uncharacterized protein n=1 Tax=Nonomuraea pusilla TaxID=46177 RepID=A0A1H7V5T6_9ACTN|nr:hypothetical protein [Nonomuraea pusilla]SEM04622.1 hypothetical protein SAMN05660976_04009 [Nonomuraea pusilla]
MRGITRERTPRPETGPGRRPVPGVRGRAFAVALAAVLLGAGCAQQDKPFTPREAADAPVTSGSRSEPSEPSEPSASATSPHTSPATPTSAPASGTQTLDVADGLRVRIDWPDAPDPLLKVIADYYVGTRRAVVEGQPRYNEGLELDAALKATAWVTEFADQERSLRGTGRLYDLRVVSRQGNGAQVSACVDESRLRLTDTRTGKPVPRQPAWTRTPYPLSVVAHRDAEGGWRIRAFVPGEGGCR